MDFNTFFTLFHLVSAYVPSNLEENDSSNHKISGYGLVLKDGEAVVFTVKRFG